MAADKDFFNLLTELAKSVRGREGASKIRRIKRVATSISRGQAAEHVQRNALKAENLELKQKLVTLGQSILELQRCESGAVQLKDEKLDKQTKKILKYFFDRASEISAQEVAAEFRLRQSVADHYIYLLNKKRFVILTRVGFRTPKASSLTLFAVAPAGRAYCIQSKLEL